MTLDSREKMIAWLVGSVLGLLVLAYIANAAYFGPLADKDRQIAKLTKDRNEANDLIDQRAKYTREWKELQAAGLTSDAAATASKISTEVFDIAAQQGFNITGWNSPGRISNKTDFDTIKFQATGTGNSKRIANFLLAIENSRLPLKIEDMTISSKKPGVDDLTIELSLTSIVYAPKTEKGTAATRPVARSSTRPASRPAVSIARGPAATGPSVSDVEAQLRLRRSQETLQPIPLPIAPPGATPEEIAAALKARRERELAGDTGNNGPDTRPTTQPTGGVQ